VVGYWQVKLVRVGERIKLSYEGLLNDAKIDLEFVEN
jgi:hypothetical protein